MEKEVPKKKSSFSLKSIFIQPDIVDEESEIAVEKNIPSAPTARTSVQTVTPSYSASSATPQAYSANGQGPKVKEMKDVLEKALENTSSLFDYPKYRKALLSMKTVITDEVVRFKSAFITAQTLNVSKTDVLKSANDCLTILSNEETKFQTEIGEAFTHSVETLEKECLAIDADIADKLEQCKKINEKIQSLSMQKNEIQMNVLSSRNEIEATKTYFAAAHNELVNEIKSDITKMTTYLEG